MSLITDTLKEILKAPDEGMSPKDLQTYLRDKPVFSGSVHIINNSKEDYGIRVGIANLPITPKPIASKILAIPYPLGLNLSSKNYDSIESEDFSSFNASERLRALEMIVSTRNPTRLVSDDNGFSFFRNEALQVLGGNDYLVSSALFVYDFSKKKSDGVKLVSYVRFNTNNHGIKPIVDGVLHMKPPHNVLGPVGDLVKGSSTVIPGLPRKPGNSLRVLGVGQYIFRQG